MRRSEKSAARFEPPASPGAKNVPGLKQSSSGTSTGKITKTPREKLPNGRLPVQARCDPQSEKWPRLRSPREMRAMCTSEFRMILRNSPSTPLRGGGRAKGVGVVACPPLKHVRSNQNDAAIDHPERLRRAYREVENTASTEWTSIVDNNNYASTACRIGYSKASPERQGPMGGSKAGATTRVIGAETGEVPPSCLR
jgi:hypothetical protein